VFVDKLGELVAMEVLWAGVFHENVRKLMVAVGL